MPIVGAQPAIFGDLQKHHIAEFAITASNYLISTLKSYRYYSHCTFINSCIGERNLKYFVGFLFVATMLCVYTATCCLAHTGHIVLSDPNKILQANKYIWMLYVGAGIVALGISLFL